MIYKKHAVLICAQQAEYRDLLCQAVSSFSEEIDIIEVEQGTDVECILSNLSFDVVFLEVDMPTQDGFTTMFNVKKNRPLTETSVVMCAEGADQVERLQSWHLGVDHYLTRAFTQQQFTTILRSIYRPEEPPLLVA